jgi:uncharacterized protein YndB with AHSA1/START domain
MAEDPYVVSVERVIAAPAERIFPLLADPARHREIDGSGTVRDAKDVPSEPLGLGSTFGMQMKAGVPYSMVNTVIEFEPNRRIAWQTRPPSVFGKLFGGRIWRYELEPADGGTRVRETWDITEERGKQLVRRAAGHTRTAMEQTLERIDALVTG